MLAIHCSLLAVFFRCYPAVTPLLRRCYLAVIFGREPIKYLSNQYLTKNDRKKALYYQRKQPHAKLMPTILPGLLPFAATRTPLTIHYSLDSLFSLTLWIACC